MFSVFPKQIAFVEIAFVALAALVVFVLSVDFDGATTRRLSAQENGATPGDSNNTSAFFQPNDDASNVEIVAIPSASDDAFGVFPTDPIALSPIVAVDASAAETVKLDPYFSRNPSSWATTAIRESRNSVFQSVGFEIWSAPNVGTERAGLLETQVDATFGLPFFTTQTPLLVSPTFAWTQIETPQNVPTPFGDNLSLFSQGFVFQYYFPVNEKLLFNVNVNALYNTDYNVSGADAWFFSGYAAAAWKLNRETNLLFGVYHNGAAETWKTTPVGGVVWKPRDDFYLEATIPYPKVARRVDWGEINPKTGVSPYWIYLSGDVAGNIWAFETDAPRDDPFLSAQELEAVRRDAPWTRRNARVRYFDFRLFAGIETKTGSDVDWAFEAGVAFARELALETVDDGPTFERHYKPNPVGIVRFRASY